MNLKPPPRPAQVFLDAGVESEAPARLRFHMKAGGRAARRLRLLAGMVLLLVVACPVLRAQVAPASLPIALSPNPVPPELQPCSQLPGSTQPSKPRKNTSPQTKEEPCSKEGADPINPAEGPRPDYGQQPKRILGFMPNIRAVSVGARVSPPTVKEKFRLATENSFDYSGLISVGFETTLRFSKKGYPQFGDDAERYGQYYWHDFVDRTIGQYLTNAVIPSLTSEDTRYYTLGTGPWYKRAAYAFTRTLITPNNSGKNTFNFSEVVGKGAVAGLGNLYYPGGANWNTTGHRWLTFIVLDGSYAVFREFWPDISARLPRLGGQPLP